LSGTQFPTLNHAGINDPKGLEKYTNTEMKYNFVTAATQHLTPAVVEHKKSGNKVIPRNHQSQQNSKGKIPKGFL
jgi:hypothetical protein